MKKTFFTILCAVIMIFSCVGCGNNEEPDYFDEGYSYTEDGKYAEALDSFEKAADKGDEQAEKAANIVRGYLNAKEAVALGNTESAKDFLNEIPSDYRFYPIADDINTLRLTVYGADAAAEDSDNTDYDKLLDEIEGLAENGHTESAIKKLDSADYDEFTERQRKRAENIRKDLADSSSTEVDTHEIPDEEHKEHNTSSDDSFTSDKALSYLKQYYSIEGDIGEALTPSTDSDGRKYYEVSIQTGSGDSIKILTLHIYGDGSIIAQNK